MGDESNDSVAEVERILKSRLRGRKKSIQVPWVRLAADRPIPGPAFTFTVPTDQRRPSQRLRWDVNIQRTTRTAYVLCWPQVRLRRGGRSRFVILSFHSNNITRPAHMIYTMIWYDIYNNVQSSLIARCEMPKRGFAYECMALTMTQRVMSMIPTQLSSGKFFRFPVWFRAFLSYTGLAAFMLGAPPLHVNSTPGLMFVILTGTVLLICRNCQPFPTSKEWICVRCSTGSTGMPKQLSHSICTVVFCIINILTVFF